MASIVARFFASELHDLRIVEHGGEGVGVFVAPFAQEEARVMADIGFDGCAGQAATPRWGLAQHGQHGHRDRQAGVQPDYRRGRGGVYSRRTLAGSMEAWMFNPTALVAEALGRHLADTYDRRFGGREPEYGRILESAGSLVIEWIANSDALYHNTNHTALSTLVGEAILRGRLLRQPLEPADWLHFTLALLMHDIGYVHGVCPGDEDDRFVIDEQRRDGDAAARRLRRGAGALSCRPRQDLRAPPLQAVPGRGRGAHRARDRDDALSGAEGRPA